MSAAVPASAQLPRPGDTIAGKYVLERLLGQGGMGAVFAAKHIKLSKAVAIKIMLADASSPEAAQRFINEGRAAANIQNEHVVRVDDVDEEMGYAYMVLELLDGEDLAQVLEREPARHLPPRVAVGYVLEALRGVAQAHAIGIVHRDLKPSNHFLAKRKDGSVVVKVLDFGISKAQGSSALAASPSALTSTKAMLGSPLYMSPEQLRSSKNVDQRADIWAIGVILYELMTGSVPFMGENLGELFAAILETDPVPMRSRVEGIPPALEEIVMRCLQRKPEHRYQTAVELTEALAPFANAGNYPSAGALNVALAGTAMLPPGSAAAVLSHAQASHAQAPVPAAAAISSGPNMARSAPTPWGTGTGAGQQSPAGAVAFGATGSPMLQQTGSGGWQSTGAGAAAIPKSKAPLIAGAILAAVVLVGGLVTAVLVVKGKNSGTVAGDPAGVSTSAAPPPTLTSLPSASATPTATESSAATAAVSSTAAATATASASASAPAPTAHGTAKVVKTSTQPKVDPPKVPDPVPKPTSTATSKSNGGLQNAR
ncbi:MAG TPA: serine/threonine-protein kinase [Labilithrix sp.]|nr:serine/threonine-protein kinase [Labilithrix sp.]